MFWVPTRQGLILCWHRAVKTCVEICWHLAVKTCVEIRAEPWK